MKDHTLTHSDSRIIKWLLLDSRTPVERLAELTGQSPHEIDGRIDEMVESGIIRGFLARPALFALGGKAVLIWGRSRLRELDEAIKRLGQLDEVAWIAHATGGRFYILLHMRPTTAKEALLREVESIAMMIKPNAAEMVLADMGFSKYEFSDLDMRIIGSLGRDARKDLKDVAIELDVPFEGVEKAYADMAASYAVEQTLDLNPDHANNPYSIVHIESLNPNSLEDALIDVADMHGSIILTVDGYSNMRHVTTLKVMPSDHRDLRDLMHSLQQAEAIPFVEVDTILSSCSMDTWRDKLVMKRHPSRKGKRP